ncbi:MAG: glycosyltransferase [Ferruginibacter sp.]
MVPTLECGGLERNVSIICNNIDTTKFEVTLAVLNNHKQFFKITNEDVTVIDLHILHVRSSLFAIRKLAKEIKPAIILSCANHLNLLLAMFRGLFPKTVRMIARESSIVSINTKHSKFSVVYDRLLRIFYKRIDLVVCQSAFMQEDLLKHYDVPANKTIVIYNAVLPPKISTAEQEINNVVKFITVARLSQEKGIDRLIKAVALLKFPYQFHIIGEGSMRKKLQQLIDDLDLQQHVFLHGSNKDPFAVVQYPDLFLMGSYYEGFPNALLEATAAGIPAVAYNAPGGIAEVLKDQVNGWLVQDESIEDFSAAIERAMKFKFNREEIRKFTINRFDVKKIMAEWEKLFRS